MQNNCWSTIPLRTMGMIRLVVENNGKLLIGWIAIWNWWQLCCSWSVAAAAAPGSWSCTGHCGELKHSCCTGRKLFRCIQTFATAAFWWWLSGTHLINTMVMRTMRRMTIMRLNLSWKLSTPNYSTIISAPSISSLYSSRRGEGVTFLSFTLPNPFLTIYSNQNLSLEFSP